MVKSVAAPQAKGKSAQDKIFGANNRANALAEKIGVDNVINGTVGSILDEDGQLVMLKVVQEAYKALTPKEIVSYAPIQGYPEYLDAVIDQCFGQSRPDGYIRACATSGGSGVLHHVIHNYSEWGDDILTSDYHWGAYGSMCNDNGRTLREFELLDDKGTFNFASFKEHVTDMVAKQYNTVIILNSPANNPTGFALTSEDWDHVLAFLKDIVKGKDKNIILVPDVAYLDYSGEKQECRKFFKKFGNLPDNILVIVAYTCSKGFTMYGQRMGAMICVTPNKDIADEFVSINQYTSRATWSNSNSAAMKSMVNICKDPAKVAELDAERAKYFNLIKERADIFMDEAQTCGLKYLPYLSGFFITIPMTDSQKVCDAMEKKNIFLVPLGKGIRLAVCSVSKKKITGLAAKLKETMDAVGAKQ
ncbi:MAG: aminotransferase class I/II-fold pyridoxal phosphate-dependent enzyme [Megasphaera sp.]|jgi:aromatic-amino-acid transaminase|nr:aminotransferase class I/II-fold pyridoxal phosphate-dependent enzyme [Megasphaera sp.]MCI1248165.1 aminotransferase class I/II-fold pyridoxal phosphate-dependent enzyme [Megasphaera sp.]